MIFYHSYFFFLFLPNNSLIMVWWFPYFMYLLECTYLRMSMSHFGKSFGCLDLLVKPIKKKCHNVNVFGSVVSASGLFGSCSHNSLGSFFFPYFFFPPSRLWFFCCGIRQGHEVRLCWSSSIAPGCSPH